MNTQHTVFSIKRKTPLIILSLPLWDFSKGLKNEFETALVDKPSVFEPLSSAVFILEYNAMWYFIAFF